MNRYFSCLARLNIFDFLITCQCIFWCLNTFRYLCFTKVYLSDFTSGYITGVGYSKGYIIAGNFTVGCIFCNAHIAIFECGIGKSISEIKLWLNAIFIKPFISGIDSLIKIGCCAVSTTEARESSSWESTSCFILCCSIALFCTVFFGFVFFFKTIPCFIRDGDQGICVFLWNGVSQFSARVHFTCQQFCCCNAASLSRIVHFKDCIHVINPVFHNNSGVIVQNNGYFVAFFMSCFCYILDHRLLISIQFQCSCFSCALRITYLCIRKDHYGIIIFCCFDRIINVCLSLGWSYPCKSDLHIFSINGTCIFRCNTDHISFAFFQRHACCRKIFTCFWRNHSAVILCTLIYACTWSGTNCFFCWIAILIQFINGHGCFCTNALKGNAVFTVFRSFQIGRPGIGRVLCIIKSISAFCIAIGFAVCIEINLFVNLAEFSDFVSFHLGLRNAVAYKLSLIISTGLCWFSGTVGTDCTMLIAACTCIQVFCWDNASHFVIVNLSFYFISSKDIGQCFVRACHRTNRTVRTFTTDTRDQGHTVHADNCHALVTGCIKWQRLVFIFQKYAAFFCNFLNGFIACIIQICQCIVIGTRLDQLRSACFFFCITVFINLYQCQISAFGISSQYTFYALVNQCICLFLCHLTGIHFRLCFCLAVVA